MERVGLEIVFTDNATAPAQPSPAPPDSLPSQSGQQPAGSLPPGPVAQPSTAPAGPPATPSASSLSAAEAAELLDKFGLRPEQVGAKVAPPAPGEDADLEARLKHQDEMFDILSPDEPTASKRRRKPASDAGAGALADDELEAPPLPGEKPPPPAKAPKAAKPSILENIGKTAAQGAAAEAGGAVAGEAGAAGAGALAVEGIAALGPAAAVVGVFALAIGGAVVATKAYVDALTAGAESIKELSPDVAGANAENEVRQINAMLRRADAVGPELGTFTRDAGRMNEALADIVTELLNVATKIYEENHDIVEALILAAKIVAVQIPAIKEQLDVVAIAVNPIGNKMLLWGEAMEAWRATAKATRETQKLLEGADDHEDEFDPLEAVNELAALVGGTVPGVAGAGGIAGPAAAKVRGIPGERPGKSRRQRTPRHLKGGFGV